MISGHTIEIKILLSLSFIHNLMFCRYKFQCWYSNIKTFVVRVFHCLSKIVCGGVCFLGKIIAIEAGQESDNNLSSRGTVILSDKNDPELALNL